MSVDQGKGAAKSGPRNTTEIDDALWSLSSHEIVAQTKIDIMQQAIAKCPMVNIACKGAQIPSLLNSGSEVALIHQTYFKEHLLPKNKTPMGEKADGYSLFHLTVVNDGQLPVKCRIRCQPFEVEGAECWFPLHGGTR